MCLKSTFAVFLIWTVLLSLAPFDAKAWWWKTPEQKEASRWVKWFKKCEAEIKANLKDPWSYRLGGTPVPTRNDAKEWAATWQFRAKNSYGAYDLNAAVCVYDKKRDAVKKAYSF
jgi:hypothetical protein